MIAKGKAWIPEPVMVLKKCTEVIFENGKMVKGEWIGQFWKRG